MKYIKVYEAKSKNRFYLEKSSVRVGYRNVIKDVEMDKVGGDAFFYNMISDKKVDKEILKLCSSGYNKLILSALKFVEKWDVEKLKEMTTLYIEVIEKPVKIYDIGGKEIDMPIVLCGCINTALSLDAATITMTNSDKKPCENSYNISRQYSDTIDDMEGMSSVKETVEKIKSMNNEEKYYFLSYLLDYDDSSYGDFPLKKVIDKITNKNLMKNYKLLSVDDFDFFD